jgi:copper chaperone CopZ
MKTRLGNRDPEAFAILNTIRINLTNLDLKKEISALDGIFNIEVDYILDTVSVRYDPDKVSLSNIEKKINTIGWRTGIEKLGVPTAKGFADVLRKG